MKALLSFRTATLVTPASVPTEWFIKFQKLLGMLVFENDENSTYQDLTRALTPMHCIIQQDRAMWYVESVSRISVVQSHVKGQLSSDSYFVRR